MKIKDDDKMAESMESCGVLLPYWARILIAASLALILIFMFLLVRVVTFIGYIGICVALMVALAVSSLEKCWDWKDITLHLAPYVLYSVVMIAVIVLMSGGSLRMLGVTTTEQQKIGFDLTYGFTNFWFILGAAVVSGGPPTINFAASIVMYGVAAFMMVYGDRMESSIVMLGGTLMCFAPMILAFTTVLLTGIPVGFFALFASGFALYGAAGTIIMAIVCIIPDALIISVLMTIERLIPEPEAGGVAEA